MDKLYEVRLSSGRVALHYATAEDLIEAMRRKGFGRSIWPGPEGEPMFVGLLGPFFEPDVVRYEDPETYALMHA